MTQSEMLNLALVLSTPGTSDISVNIGGKDYIIQRTERSPKVGARIRIVAQTSDNKVIRLDTVEGADGQAVLVILDTANMTDLD